MQMVVVELAVMAVVQLVPVLVAVLLQNQTETRRLNNRNLAVQVEQVVRR